MSTKIATSLCNNKIYLLNKPCEWAGCVSIASRHCNSVCGSFTGCGKYICEDHVKIFAVLEESYNHFVPYNIETRSD